MLVLDCKQTVTKLKSPIVPTPRNCYRRCLLFKNVIVIKISFRREWWLFATKKKTRSVTTVHLWTLTAAFCSTVWECRHLNHQGLNWCLSPDSWQQITSVSPSADELKLHGLKFSNVLFHSFPETVCGCRTVLRLRSLCGCLKHSSTQKTPKGPVCKIYDDIPWEMEYSIRSCVHHSEKKSPSVCLKQAVYCMCGSPFIAVMFLPKPRKYKQQHALLMNELGFYTFFKMASPLV